MSRAGPGERYALVGALYVSQAVPLGFLIIAVPAILRSRGLGLEGVGLLGALALPWLLKFLWAPLIDRYAGFGGSRFGHYRSWIVPLQVLSVLAVIALVGVDLREGLGGLIAAGALFMFLSATQDIATDGLAVRALQPEERGTANGIQVGGYYLGQILGGGAVLVLYHRFGWVPAIVVMAALLAAPLIPTLRYREPPFRRRAHATCVDGGAIRRFLGRPGAGTWVLILLLFRTGEAMTLTMATPMLVDLGLTLERIGILLGVGGSLASLAGALSGGLLIRSLGRRTSLMLFGLLQAFALCGYLLPASGIHGTGVLYAVIGTAAFASGMASAALYTNMMDRSDPATAATDFTLQQSVCATGPLLGSVLSGVSAAALGYGLHFLVSAVVALAGVAVVARWLTPCTATPPLPDPIPDAG